MIFDFDLLTIAILFVIYIIVDIIVYIKNRDIIWIIFSFIAFVYLANVIKLTLFPFYIGISFPNNLAASVNIIPFKKCLNKNYKFDYIIMDESSQVDLITGVLALSVAKNAVIVGDLKQLPNVITTDNKNIIEEISKKYMIPSNYN